MAGHVWLSVRWRPVVNFRWRIDFGENRDIEVAVDTLHARYPRAPIVAIAYSAGAHVLLTYLQVRAKIPDGRLAALLCARACKGAR